MFNLIKLFIVLGSLYTEVSLSHHSFTAEFTAERTVIMQGQVGEVWFRNPHVRYILRVENSEGISENWDLRGSPVVWLARKGWTKDSIKVGDKIIVEGYPGHSGRKMLSLIRVTLANGNVLIDRAPE